jgi:hypothetical protein
MSQAEAEELHYASLYKPAVAALLKKNRLRQNWGGSP